MTSIHRISLLAILCTVTTIALAQPDISKTPVSSETTIKEQLFSLDTLEVNYYFRANLPTDNFLAMEFKKLSYWPGKGNLRNIFEVARDVVKSTSDSFINPGTSKRVDIHIPSKGESMTIRLFEHDDRGDLLVMKRGEQAPLKVGMDTIRIMRTYAEIVEDKEKASEKKLVQVQYTLILKDLDEINDLVNHTAVEDAENIFDSLVNRKRKKWSKQDMWFHAIDAVYNPTETKPKKRLQVDGSSGLLRGYSVDINIGASLYRNTLAPNLSYCVNYKWLKKDKEYSYIGLSVSTLRFFPPAATGIDMKDLTFVNLETGTFFNKMNTLIPAYKSSIGVGLLLNTPDKLPGVGSGFTLFFKYSLSKAVTISTDFYFMDDGTDNGGFVGLTAYFKIL